MQAYHVWGMDDAGILLSQRTGGGRAAALGATRKRAVCQRVLMIANLLEGMEHEAAARLAGLSRSAAYEWHNPTKRKALRDCVTGRARVGSHASTP